VEVFIEYNDILRYLGGLVMSEVMKKAEKLAEAIVESDEFLAMKESELKVDADEEASQLVEKVENLQKKIDRDKKNEELKKRMAELQRKTWQNRKIKTFLQKQQQFSKLMKRVNTKITDALNPESSE